MSNNASTRYLGKRQMMNCGMMATIIEYKNATDVTVRFDDGTTLYHQVTANFNMGKILNPNLRTERYKRGGDAHRNSTSNKYMYKSNMMKSGLKTTVISYRNYNDIDVEFEDGYIVEGATIKDFLDGNIRYKGLNSIFFKKRMKNLGETNMMSCNKTATIIAYRGTRDIDVRFSDGSVLQHRSMYAFRIGKISDKDAVKLYNEYNWREDNMTEREKSLREDIETAIIIIPNGKELEFNEVADGEWYAYQYTDGVGAEPIHNSIFENKPIITNKELIENNINLEEIVIGYGLCYCGNIPII